MFRDRSDAGRQLAARLGHLAAERPVVLGLPRGGVAVATEVAEALGAALDVIVVRKLGAPGQPELGLGAIGEHGVRALNESLMRMVGVTSSQLDSVEAAERRTLDARCADLRAFRPEVDLAGRFAIIVDDGLATGYTARAAILTARQRRAHHITLAVPVAAPQTVRELASLADDVIAVEQPSNLRAVGLWYQDFSQTRDDEVRRLLRGALPLVEDVRIRVDATALEGFLGLPRQPGGIIAFAHGSGSSKSSPRNTMVARHLMERGLATLLFDLLTPAEARDRRNVFDIQLLMQRLIRCMTWLRAQPVVGELPLGLFGASTGAAAALGAAAHLGKDVAAVVSRGGRPDLAGSLLSGVTAPCLLIVGERDAEVLRLNRLAASQLDQSDIAIVPEAGHLFEGPGQLLEVARLAGSWFGSRMPPGGSVSGQ